MTAEPEESPGYEKYLAQTWTNEVTKYDRTILTLGTGALVLSIALLRDGITNPVLPEIALIGWVALLGSMGCVVWSYVIGKAAVEARWNRNHPLGNQLSDKAWTKSITAGWLLAVGAFLLVVFTWLNLIK